MNHQSATITQKLSFNFFKESYKNLSEATIGNRIEKARLSKGYTQKDLATSLNISYSTVEDYESNKCYPSPDILICVSQTLEKPLEYFCDDYYKFIFNNFTEKIKNWRLNNNLTFWQAGKVTGINYRSIRNWENGSIIDRNHFDIFKKFL
ncbi:helix-turn-helix transcriptional regulator [Clostridium akagii]|uniref:helix-turn-helix transcriptional regulator n=1 Tax=Clostridium akagii TaxID=91623 RepID=UPI000565D74E|nr:helix-turn-helix transcriptional regulator [Clostridium akagii]